MKDRVNSFWKFTGKRDRDSEEAPLIEVGWERLSDDIVLKLDKLYLRDLVLRGAALYGGVKRFASEIEISHPVLYDLTNFKRSGITVRILRGIISAISVDPSYSSRARGYDDSSWRLSGSIPLLHEESS